MQLAELLSADRILLRSNSREEPTKGAASLGKKDALGLLASALAEAMHLEKDKVERVLLERETLQSTGIGEGVAIPHGAFVHLNAQCAAMLIVPDGVDFDALDGMKVHIFFAVICPKRATGEHLKTLARISRLLRNKALRQRLLSAPSGAAAYGIIAAEEGSG